MGNDAMAVVGPHLRVRGVDGLRICDFVDPDLEGCAMNVSACAQPLV